jgi:hypothetical protein
LTTVVPLALNEGTLEFLIESRGPQVDIRDRVTMVEALKEHHRPEVVYSWHDKNNPQMWLADAACGAIAGYLTGIEPHWHQQLEDAGVSSQLVYIRDS